MQNRLKPKDHNGKRSKRSVENLYDFQS